MKVLLVVALLGLFACGGSGPCEQPPDVSDLDFSSARKKLPKLSSLCVLDPPQILGSGKLQPKNGTLPYDLTTPLFSDYAEKFRTLWIPPGSKIQYRDPEPFDFPVGTIITKTFAFPADLRTPTQNVKLVETRVLMRTNGGWLTLPYVWKADESDAAIDILGSLYTEPFVDALGATRTPNYLIPSANQCLLCHEGTDPAHPIGPKARLLNRTYPYETGEVNQIDHLVSLDMLQDAPASSAAPIIPPYSDPTAGPLGDRARGWLETNCAHCHSETGGARTTGLYLAIAETDPFRMGICKPPVAAGSGTGGRKYDIIPGNPEASIIPFRLEATNASMMMPPVGRSLVHSDSVAVIKEWIASLPGTCNSVRRCFLTSRIASCPRAGNRHVKRRANSSPN